MSAEPDKFTTVRPGGWWGLGLLVAVYVLSFVDRTILSSLGEPIRRDLGLSDVQLGLLGGMAFALTYSALGLPAAFLSERIRRKTLIALAIILWCGMTMACGFASGFLALLVMRAGVGVGEAGFSPSAHALISDYFPPARRALALSLFNMSIPVAALIAAIGGGWLAHTAGWRHAFVAVGLPGLILAPLVFLSMREPERGESEGARAISAVPFRQVLKQITRSRSSIPVILAGAFATVPGYAIFTFGVSYFVRVHKLDLVAATAAFGAIVAGGQFIGMLAGGAIADRFARERPTILLLLPAGVLVISSLCQIAAWQQASLLACLILLGLGMILGAAYLGPSFAAMHNLLTPRTKAGGMSIVLLAHTLIGLGFGPPLIGLVSDRVAAGKFGPGFAQACHGALGHGAPALPLPCADATAAGVTAALSVSAVFFLVAAAFFGLASRSYRQDISQEGEQ